MSADVMPTVGSDCATTTPLASNSSRRMSRSGPYGAGAAVMVAPPAPATKANTSRSPPDEMTPVAARFGPVSSVAAAKVSPWSSARIGAPCDWMTAMSSCVLLALVYSPRLHWVTGL